MQPLLRHPYVALLANATAILFSQWLVAADLPELSVRLGPTNISKGLHVPNAGDGSNIPVMSSGEAARQTSERAPYLYVAVANPSWKGPVDCYAIVEAYDGTIGRVVAQYDKASPSPNIGTKYSTCPDTMLLTGSGQWRRGVFHLPDLRIGHGQNSGADFRLVCQGIPIRAITLTTSIPVDWDPNHPIPAATLKELAVERPAGMELTFGNDASPADAAVFKALSVTSVESYVDWAGVEPAPGKWDWSRWDKQVDVLTNAGLKWVPFLIAGSAYATPLWFHHGVNSHYYRCLEHGRDSKVQSLFNPQLRPQIERFIQAFAARYQASGAIESVLLGITGIYGESIYPAGPEGGWTAKLTGDYHNHHGWWAGDPYAVAAFRQAMQHQYRSITELNRAWRTTHKTFEDVGTFLPDMAPSERARADFVEWYQQAMTDWAVFWVRTARKAFPKTEIYLCTGGDGNPMLGADFTAQTAAIVGEGAGVRITNEGSDYAHNFAVTREVATATRLYATYCGFEPASGVDSNGVVARIYNATASGAHQLHDYIPNTLGQSPNALRQFRANANQLVPRKPVVDAAIYLSRETWALDAGAIGRTLALSRVLRDVTDIDFLTRRTVTDGHLAGYKAIVLADCAVLDPKASEAVEKWVTDGGTLIAATRPGETFAGRLYDQSAWRQRMLASATPAARLLQPTLAGPAPMHWVLGIGKSDDDGFLEGDWFSGETKTSWTDVPNATMRWAGAETAVLLPVTPGIDHLVRLSANIPGAALGPGGIKVRLNGQPLSTIKEAGRHELEWTATAALIGKSSLARLEFSATTWKPSERERNNQDTRALGFAVRQIEVLQRGAESQPVKPVAIRFSVVPQKLAPLTRAIGKGRTIHLGGLANDSRLVAMVLASVLPNNPDGQLDNRFVTVTGSGPLWFDAKAAKIWEGKR